MLNKRLKNNCLQLSLPYLYFI